MAVDGVATLGVGPGVGGGWLFGVVGVLRPRLGALRLRRQRRRGGVGRAVADAGATGGRRRHRPRRVFLVARAVLDVSGAVIWNGKCARDHENGRQSIGFSPRVNQKAPSLEKSSS